MLLSANTRFNPKQRILPRHREAVLEYLLHKNDAYLDELDAFLVEEFDLEVHKSTISRLLKSLD